MWLSGYDTGIFFGEGEKRGFARLVLITAFESLLCML